MKERLVRLKSLRPIPFIRSARRLEEKQRRFENRLQKLQEDLALLGGDDTSAWAYKTG